MIEPMTKKVQLIILLTVVGKMILMTIFSSGYQDQLFVPFVTQFLQEGGNPWQWVQSEGVAVEFPYPPFMLYLLAFFLSPILLFDDPSPLLINFLSGIPVILADLLIFFLLVRQYPWRKTESYLFYFISPIIIFSTFIHRQLDIIPSALLFLSCCLLAEKRYSWSALVVGIAITTKFHVVALMPLIVVYLVQKHLYTRALLSVAIPVFVYAVLSAPFMFSPEYLEMVLLNPKQQGLFEAFYSVGDVKIYLPLLVVSFIYLQLLAYNKVNIDLFFALVGTLFSVFLVLIVPSPGWYVWIVPFLTIFFIRYFEGSKSYVLYGFITLLYLNYFVLFHQYEFQAIKLFGFDVNVSLSQFGDVGKLRDISFTVLESALFMIVLLFYVNGLRSNRIYAKSKAFLIGIGGDSGAGKTTLLKSLADLMGRLSVSIEGDGDHRWMRGSENWQKYTHLNPQANRLHKQAAHLSNLKFGARISRLDYDHDNGQFFEMDNVKPKDFVLFSGLHAFYLPTMREVIDLKIFMDLDENLRRKWKIIRDMQKRGHSEEAVLAALEKREADSERYIRPQKHFADVVLRYFEAEDSTAEREKLGLQITMKASIDLDAILQEMEKHQVVVERHYEDDLTHQSLVLPTEPENIDFGQLFRQFIAHRDELVDQPRWQPGYNGFIQFMVMYIIYTMKEEEARDL